MTTGERATMKRLTRTITLCLTLAFAGLAARPAAAEVDKKTVRTWKAKCSSCHGEDGKGQTEQGKKMGIRDMSSPAFTKDMTDAKMKDAILNGVKVTKE